MSAFIFNERMQTLSQRSSQVNCAVAETPEGISIKIDYWRWQFWSEKGSGDWDTIFVSVGEARELAYSILAAIGKDKRNDKATQDSTNDSPAGNCETGDGISPDSNSELISIPTERR